MQYLSKLIVLTSMAAALLVAAHVNSAGWHAAPLLTLAAFAIASLVAIVNAPLSAALVLLFAYTFPVFVVIAPGQYPDAYTDIWMAGLLGAMLPASVMARGWALPTRWKAPLGLWALTVALAWPFVALRQIDFVPAVMDLPYVGVSIRGLSPDIAILWIANVALALGLGILWFDWLFAIGKRRPEALQRWIVPSLISSWVLATVVALYQFLVDMTYLNSGTYGDLGRASGTMRDANVFGMIAALCGPAVVVVCRRLPERSRYWVMAAGLMLSWLGVWASASRTALAAAIIALVFILNALRRESTHKRALLRGGLAALTSATIVLIAVVRWGPPSMTGPYLRLKGSLPTASVASLADVVYELLWRRNAYGTAAVAMIRDHPLVGVGVGAYHLLTADYGALIGYVGILVPDNAQNWYRHQLAEFGILGSLGWIVWVGTFVAFLFRAAKDQTDSFSLSTIRGALVALGLISLVGMPTQHVSVALTFWTLAYWYVSIVEAPPDVATPRRVNAHSAIWTAVLAMAITCSLGTWYAARHDLRIPNMARRVGWDYSYGLYDPETDADGRVFRWTMQHAVAVIPAPERWLKLTVLVNHADLAAHPVQAKVWRDGTLVLDRQLTRVEPVTAYTRVPDGQARVALDFWSSRVEHPSDFGLNDPRELGLEVAWDFVATPSADDASTPHPP